MMQAVGTQESRLSPKENRQSKENPLQPRADHSMVLVAVSEVVEKVLLESVQNLTGAAIDKYIPQTVITTSKFIKTLNLEKTNRCLNFN